MNTGQTKAHFISVGRSVIRPDVQDKVCGRAVYVADLQRIGMLHAVTVRSSVAAMKNVSIDATAARIMPGVVRIITASDIPGSRQVPLIFTDQPFLALDEIRFHSEPVALVVAETREQAKAAAAAVKVTGEVQNPIMTPEDALSAKSRVIFQGEFGRNVFKQYHIARGDLSQAWAESDIIIDRIYRTPHQEHAYLETQGMVAEADENQGIRVFGSMQCPFYVQDAVAAILGAPRAQITVIQTVTGGGFGGKEDVPSILAGHAALLTRITGKPVSLIYDRDEDFQAMSKRHPSIVRVKIGVRTDGTVTGAEVLVTLDGGAYATLSPIVLWRSTVHAAGPYNWRAVRIDSQAVATNTVPNGAFRGFGEPQVVFAIESAMDEAAMALGMDPLEFRLKNVIRSDGDITATGHPIAAPGMVEALEKAAAEVRWAEKYHSPMKKPPALTDKPVRGLGCSASFYGVGLGAEGKRLDRAGAYVQVESDGSIRVFIGNTEMGQGARGAISQIVSETLAAPFDKIHVNRADTSRVPDSGPTVASRTTVMSGGAVMNACISIRNSLETAVAAVLNCEQEKVIADERGFFTLDSRDSPISFQRAVTLASERRLPLAASGWFVSPETSFDRDGDGQGNAYMTYVWSANIAEVEVDPGTLQVKILKLIAAHDVGKAINPQEVHGQIQGGALQGLGYALSESIAYSGVVPTITPVPDGIMLNAGFSGYICPTAMDAPEIIPIIIENPFREGPYGARGIGEPPLIGVAPAVANAVANALGVRVRELPLCPEHILDAMQKQETRS